MKPGNIFLVGLMGAGKTTVGRLLARRLKLRFFDSDHEIEERCGVKIPLVFDIEGEAGFRAREEQAIAELTAMEGIVLATGGGAVLSADSRRRLSARRHRDLSARPARRPVRTRAPRPQPAAARRPPSRSRGCARCTLSAMRSIASVADLVVDTGAQSVQFLVRELVDRLEEQWKRSA